jgi:orotidine-5'-phosphate decarboxylase
VPEPARTLTPASTAPASALGTGFGERLVAHVTARQSQIVLGLDPDPMALWPEARMGVGGSPSGQVATAMLTHCRALIDAAGPACVAVKPQLARFEVLGGEGWRALHAVVRHAHAAGLLVIADAKRGDIDVSARAYAQALMSFVDTPLGAIRGLDADMITVNPLMGADAVAPFLAVARNTGGPEGHTAGVLVLVRTSNPGAADVEDLQLAGGGTVWERIASMVAQLGAEHVGESGLNDVGAVVGATAPQHLARARELMPHSAFLLPGIGAQGGRVEDLAAAFAPGRAGGLISASRSIANAHRAPGTSNDPPAAARAEAERLRELAWDISK